MLLIAASITRKFWVVTSTSSGRFLSAGRKRSGGTLCNAARLPTLWETTLPSKKSKQDKDKQTSKALLEASSNTAAADAAATAASATADCCARLDVGILRENGNIVENCLPVAMEARSGSSSVEQKRKLNIVVEGCCHGELPKIYASVEKMERAQGIKVDLVICCGDFQCLRNTVDFKGLACPDKYKQLGSFFKYYSGQEVAPYLTVFIGGNHEASSYLQELHYGGWVAPKIYFMGFAGVINVGGVRIAGLTGIFNERSYREGRHERPPYDSSSLRSVYYVRELEVFKLAQLTGHVDLCLSHDWPRGIARYGDAEKLFRAKPFFKNEVIDNSLGSPAAEQLLHKIQPDYWFSAHLHVKFAAVVRHESRREGQGRPDAEVKGVTRFLSLDKCLPRRDFLQLISVPRPDGAGGAGEEVLVEHDVEWLSILKASHHLLTNSKQKVAMPYESRRVPQSEKDWVRDRLAERGLPGGPLVIADNFKMTAPPQRQGGNQSPAAWVGLLPNPQTDELLSLLGLDHVVTVQSPSAAGAEKAGGGRNGTGVGGEGAGVTNRTADANEIDLDATVDPNEIQLDDA